MTKFNFRFETRRTISPRETAVVDAFSLYSIAVRHEPHGPALRDSAEAGNVRLVASVLSLTVACAMRSCGDSTCDQEHPEDAAGLVLEFGELGGVEVAGLAPGQILAVARLYVRCDDRRIGGAEVLAACHSVLLAESRAAKLISTVRASYCYVAIPELSATGGIELI